MPTIAHPGTVYLVGAGPGDPDLITVRGLRLLQQADVVVYDRLVHPDLVDEAPPAAERLYVGKAPGGRRTTQEQINALLVDRARQRRVVVRLKGGDPFVFGRGGEEALALRETGLSFEVVPGITSAVSAPAFAGIPVTQRHVASAFTVVTGHTCREDGGGLDWEALARAGTLVVLMGLGRIRCITDRLLEQGRPPETPVAVVRCATTAEQQVVTGTLADVADRVAHLRPPATIVVGEVARLAEQLDWFAAPHDTAPGFPALKRLSAAGPPRAVASVAASG